MKRLPISPGDGVALDSNLRLTECSFFINNSSYISFSVMLPYGSLIDWNRLISDISIDSYFMLFKQGRMRCAAFSESAALCGMSYL